MQESTKVGASRPAALLYARRWGPLLVLVVVSLVVLHWRTSVAERREQRLHRVYLDFQEIHAAFYSVGVDKVAFPHTWTGNYLSPVLTTPLPYLRSLPNDPFSPAGELYKLASQPWPLGTGFFMRTVVVSRGPDGDWDIEKLPRSPRWASMLHQPDMAQVHLATGQVLKSWNFSIPDVEFYLREDGTRVEGTLIPDAIMLPEDTAGKDYPILANRVELSNYLTKHGVSQYDPTNGLWSDGDMILVYPEDNHYQVEGVDLFPTPTRNQRP